MVKLKPFLVLFLAALVAGCGASGGAPGPAPEVAPVPAVEPGRAVSIGIGGGQVFAVFSDAASTTLKLLHFPLADHLPDTLPAAEVIDKIDVAPPLSPRFGAHVISVSDTDVNVLYLARQGEDKTVLKLARRAREAAQWTMDIVEPPGEPLAILPAGTTGGLSLFWAGGALMTRDTTGGAMAQVITDSFTTVDRASVGGPAAFTAWDSGSRSLVAVTRRGDGYAAHAVAGAQDVQASLVLPDGRLAVLTWDEGSQRLFLLEEKAGGATERTTVTLCDGTTAVALLPARSGYLFLFDEAQKGAVGGPRHALSLLARFGARYRKTILLSGTDPVEGLAAVRTDDALYVIVQQGGIKLVRIAVPRT
jgi:hypothetical protein